MKTTKNKVTKKAPKKPIKKGILHRNLKDPKYVVKEGESLLEYLDRTCFNT